MTENDDIQPIDTTPATASDSFDAQATAEMNAIWEKHEGQTEKRLTAKRH
jgi:hypothetical protein